jgi:2-polyprenyl-6-methoxyphenol hydroxylase-like FAD-dependent oxidoreductase
MREMRTEVVVVGAGPVGLMLAGELRRARVPVVVVERLAKPMTESRASLLTTLTAELLHERGFDSLLAEAGYEPRTHFGGLPFDVSDVDSDYAGNWKVPQYRTESVLGRRAADLGATLLRAHELTEVSASDEQVACVVRGPADDMLIRARYLVGCDGAASTVRCCREFTSSVTSATKELIRADVTGIEIPDRRFERREHGFAAASTRDGVTRVMVHTYGQEVAGRTEPPRFPEVVRLWQQVTGEDIAHGNAIWIDAFDNSTGLADSYRQGRVFLAGDAAHWHMPIGGQALNVGLQDAVNLGWKLAATVNGWADAGLLDSYHDERHPVAKRVLGYVAAQGLLLIGGREYDPLRAVLAELIGLDQVRGHLARVVSGLDDRYGSGGSPLAGRRIGNVTPRTAYHALAAAGLLAATEPVLVLGSPAADGPAAPVLPGGRRLRVVHVPPGGNGPAARNPAMLVRPDGYIAWAGDDEADLNQALELLFGVQPIAS